MVGNKKNKRKNWKLPVFLFSLITIGLILGNFNQVQAAYYSTDIDGINEAKYPGYKDKLKLLQKAYPNIQLFYTGLDWNTVIKNEREHGRNLVPASYSNDWKCPVDGNVPYDTGWYCASDEAVKYLMDPRLYLDPQNVFQFQKLNTSAGTLNKTAIKIAAKNSFLDETNTANAIYDASYNNNINAFHIVTRTIQEQGRSGTSTLSAGQGYTDKSGTLWYPGVYNLFSIGATGKNAEEVKINGLARASQEGWTSRALSITGGASFLKNKYLDRNQNTLYLQKFDVDSGYDGLYWHQYMQNLMAAKSEASLMYTAYNNSGLLLNKDFQFVIPIYENMPSRLSTEPGREYDGGINTDVKQINLITSGSSKYISGNMLIAEWIDGVANVPSTMPKLTLKSTDGTFSRQMYSYHQEGLSYYFDTILDGLEMSKEYYIEAELTSPNNIGNHKTMIVLLPNKTLGNLSYAQVKLQNNKIVFVYEGAINTDVKEFNIIKNGSGDYYITGSMLVAEWINGTAYIPSPSPKIVLKSVDGEFEREMYSFHQEGLSYYFDTIISNLDAGRQYYIEAQLTNTNNTSNRKTMKVALPERTQKIDDKKTIIVKDNVITIEGGQYEGAINTDLKQINLITSGSSKYISGNLLIAEWIDGIAYTPKNSPKLTLKSTDGSFSRQMYSFHQEGLSYYFDTILDGLEKGKEYYIEAELTTLSNISTHKTMTVALPEKILGKYQDRQIELKDNKVRFIYEGAINTDVKEINMGQNGNGDHYIYGKLLIAEWIDGVANVPSTMPKLTLKATDGSYSQGIYSYNQGGLSYYFDTYVENLDKTKTYYVEAELTNPNNTLDKTRQKQNFKYANKRLGDIGSKTLIIEDNLFKFRGYNEYVGAINTDVKQLQMGQNGDGAHYIYGNLLIAEWVDGVANIPSTMPKLTLKSTDGSYSQGIYSYNQGGLSYYFDTYVENLDKTKTYYIEAELTNPNNIGELKNQKQSLKYYDISLGMVQDYKLQMSNNTLTFKENTYEGAINTDIKEINMGQNGDRAHYIYGNLLIAEWVDGIANTPSTMPKLTLKATDGSYSQGMYSYHKGGLSYYFDTYIENLDKTKSYYIEAELTNPNNIGEPKKQKQSLKYYDISLGMIQDYKLQISNNILTFKENTYEGAINTDVKRLEMAQNSDGAHYIYGNLLIAEWVDGVANIPSTMPKLTLKSTDRSYSQGIYSYHQGGLSYYFDTYIENLDKTKTYYIEAELTNPKNTLEKARQKQTWKFLDKELGVVGDYKAKLQDNKLVFSKAGVNLVLQEEKEEQKTEEKPIEFFPQEKEQKQDEVQDNSSKQEEPIKDITIKTKTLEIKTIQEKQNLVGNLEIIGKSEGIISKIKKVIIESIDKKDKQEAAVNFNEKTGYTYTIELEKLQLEKEYKVIVFYELGQELSQQQVQLEIDTDMSVLLLESYQIVIKDNKIVLEAME